MTTVFLCPLSSYCSPPILAPVLKVGFSHGPPSRSMSTIRCASSHGDSNTRNATHVGATNSPFKNTTVSVFWDLDNKPPTSSPYDVALCLHHAASQFGSVVNMVAYANRHAFVHVPQWVREQRQSRRELDFLESVGIVNPREPYVCHMCGRKCRTNILLRKHFKQLHEREQKKRMDRLHQLKGKRKVKFGQSIHAKSERYTQAAQSIITPKVGYGLQSDLRRAGIFVRTVQDKPQAADIELRKHMQESMNRGVKCICLVSDDRDFSDMLCRAQSQDLHTIVFGESMSLRRYADFWFHWGDVLHGIPQIQVDKAISQWMDKQIGDLPSHVWSSGAKTGVQHTVFPCNQLVSHGISTFSEEEERMFGMADEHEDYDDDDVDCMNDVDNDEGWWDAGIVN